MAGEYAALTVASLNAGGRFVGIEAGSIGLDGITKHLAAAKDSLRARADEALDTLYAEFGVEETTLFDAVAALTATSDASDLYWHLIRLLSFETLAQYYSDRQGRPGKKADFKARHARYVGYVEMGLPRLAYMIREAEENDDLTLTSDKNTREDRTHWIA